MQSRTLRILPIFLFVVLLPTMIFRGFTPSNELRYLSIADEAIGNGDIFTFSNQGEPYADKPPLYLWIVMLGRWLFGAHAMWFLSLFSLVPALVIIYTMNRWVERVTTPAERVTATLQLMSCGLFLGLSFFLRMDMLMNMFITLAIYTFYRMYSGEADPLRSQFLFGVWLFLAIFTKGPVGLLVPLISTVTFLVVKRKLGTIGRYWGWRTWTVLLVGCGLWWGGVLAEGGEEYLRNLLFHQTFDRAVDAFHHKEPFYYYLISLWYSMAPWSLFAVFAIAAGVWRCLFWSDLEQLFLTVILSTLVMLSVFSSKIAIYLSPIFPFVIYLGALACVKLKRRGYLTACVVVPAVAWIVALPGVVVVAHWPGFEWLNVGWIYCAAAILMLAGVVAVAQLFRFRRTLRPAINSLAVGLLAALFVGGFALPKINARLGYGELCRRAVEVAEAEGVGKFYVWGIPRPENMDVYLGQDVQKISSAELLEDEIGDGVVLLSLKRLDKKRELRSFVAGRERDTVGRYLIVVP